MLLPQSARFMIFLSSIRWTKNNRSKSNNNNNNNNIVIIEIRIEILQGASLGMSSLHIKVIVSDFEGRDL